MLPNVDPDRIVLELSRDELRRLVNYTRRVRDQDLHARLLMVLRGTATRPQTLHTAANARPAADETGS